MKNEEKMGKPITIGRWGKFEVSVKNPRTYDDPYRDVSLHVYCIGPNGRQIEFWGFYDEDATWRIRFMPDRAGLWKYKAKFSDASSGIEGRFVCMDSDLPGMIHKDEVNPIWFGFKGGNHTLLRSFHVGDRFFASNWPDKEGMGISLIQFHFTV